MRKKVYIDETIEESNYEDFRSPNIYYEGMTNKQIQEIAWNKYKKGSDIKCAGCGFSIYDCERNDICDSMVFPDEEDIPDDDEPTDPDFWAEIDKTLARHEKYPQLSIQF